MRPGVRRRGPLLRNTALAFVGALTAAGGATADDPELIVFASARSGEGDLYAIDPSTGGERPVLLSDLPEGSPRYDAARRRVVYAQFGGDGAWLCANGERLRESPNADVPPVWSPDGEWIAYTHDREGREDLFIARVDGSEERRLTDDLQADRYPAWSPDGRSLVFARRIVSGWELFVLQPFSNIDEPRRLTTRSEYVGHPAWSPDGRRIAFDTSFDGDTEIGVLDLDSERVTRVTNRPGNDLVPAWAPDGATIAFGGETDGAWDVWIVEVESGRLTRLTDDPAFDGAPVYVPPDVID